MSILAREYRNLAGKYGFVLVRTKRHAVFRHPTGGTVVCPASPSDSKRGLKQFEKDIKKALSSSVIFEKRH